MSQPSGPGVPPEFQPPPAYGYGQPSYGQPSYGQPGYGPPGYQPQPVLPPAPLANDVPVPATLSNPPQRPAVIGLATTLAATASLQWVCVLSFTWLVAVTGTAQLQTSGVDGGVYHALDRISSRLEDGLAWPLYLFPAASFVLGFVLLTRHEWARWAFTVTGAAAVGWSAWWLRDDLVWWSIPTAYLAVTVLITWTGQATRWFRWRPAPPVGSYPPGQPG